MGSFGLCFGDATDSEGSSWWNGFSRLESRRGTNAVVGAIPKCGHVALVLDCYYVDICVIFSSSGSLRMRLISQFSRASGARFSETDDSPETVVGRWILPAKLKALLGSSAILSQVVPGKDLMAESKSPLFGIAPCSCSRKRPTTKHSSRFCAILLIDHRCGFVRTR